MEQKIYNPWPYKENKHYTSEDIKKGFLYLCTEKNKSIFKKYCEGRYEKAKTNDRNFNIFLDLIGATLWNVTKFGEISQARDELLEQLPAERTDLREICWKYDVTKTRLHQIFSKYMILLKRTIKQSPDKDVEILMGEPVTKHIEHEGKIIYEHDLQNIRDNFEAFVKVHVHSQEFVQGIRESEYVQQLIEFAHPDGVNYFFKTAVQIFNKYVAFKKYVTAVEKKFAELP